MSTEQKQEFLTDEEKGFYEAFGIPVSGESAKEEKEEVPMFNPNEKAKEPNKEVEQEVEEESFEKALGINEETTKEKPSKKESTSGVDFYSIYKYKVQNEGWAEINEEDIDWNDEETFNLIIEEQNKLKKDESPINEIEEFWKSINDKDWLKKQLINEKTVQDVDVSDPDQAINLLSYYYVQTGRMSESDFDRLMSKKTADELTELAEEKQTEIQESIKENIRLKAEQDKIAKQEEMKVRKEYEKKFLDFAKSKQKTESQAKKMLKEIMPSDDGKPSALTLAIIDKMKDPKNVLTVYEFFMNQEAFVAGLEGKAKQKIMIKTLEKETKSEKPKINFKVY